MIKWRAAREVGDRRFQTLTLSPVSRARKNRFDVTQGSLRFTLGFTLPPALAGSLNAYKVATSIWHIISSEYPPQTGGVSDYTQLVARGLADAGDEVHIWGPSAEGISNDGTNGDADGSRRNVDSVGVSVHREFGGFTAGDLRRVGKLLDQFRGPRRLLVQWVPHGYGYRSMNLPFCFWLRRRAVMHHDVVELMIHEPYLTFGEGSWKQSGVAVVHRLMTMVLLNAARRVWISIPAWEKLLRPYALRRSLPFIWLPVPSNIPVVDDPAAVATLRNRIAPAGQQLVGHFGTYDRHIAGLLSQALPLLLQENNRCHVLLLGRGSEQMRNQLTVRHPDLAGRVHAAGALPAAELSLHLSACDLMLQPYPDGVSGRRTSTMVSLAHGLPVVTTSGHLTEPLWAQSRALFLAPIEEVPALVSAAHVLLENADLRSVMGEAARSLYRDRFDLQRTIRRLREATI